MAWEYPKGGRFPIVVLGGEDIVKDVEEFFVRELARYDHSIYYDFQPYVVFFFSTMPNAERYTAKFKGEWFDSSDKGWGSHWSRWYKGKTAKQSSRRWPHDFG